MLYDRYVTKGENYLKFEVLCGMMEMVLMREATTTVFLASILGRLSVKPS